MTGKRPRPALTRTASVSQLSSGTFSQEFSPLPENPKEKHKATVKEASPPACAPSLSAPRVVIGFDPKPALHGGCFGPECAIDSPKSAPCSPSFNDKASSPRSVLNSLFSRQRCVKPSDGVGLGIALNPPALVSEEIKIDKPLADADHIAILVRDDTSPPRPREIPVAHSRRHSHPIPTPGINAHHFSHEIHSKPAPKGPPNQPVARPVLGWLEQEALNVDRRDTFLLSVSPSRSINNSDVSNALTAATHFLDKCSFCKRHLPEDKDIYMYRGDKAFCSVECRSEQMLMDEPSKNCASLALKRAPGAVAPPQRKPASSVAAA